MQGALLRSETQTIVLVGNYLPRKCGIATFTTDLLTALAIEVPEAHCWAVAMNDIPEGYRYPARVRFEVQDKRLTEYRLAADFLNMNQVDIICLQHEFGIFGGNAGSHVIELLSNLRMPVVTTLHTVLTEPDPTQRSVFEQIIRFSDRLVVMSHKAGEILREVYHIPEEKIVLIHHGIPDVPFVDPNYYKDQFGVEGRKVILTFGLVSPGKGIEYMIDALPEIVRQYPETTYLVLGATHPHVLREQGEAYRLSLQLRAKERGVNEHVIFHNRFVTLEELCEFLGAADIYVTPYLGEAQIVSGTLAYALGAGKATISTPYWYATEMLGDGRGRIAPFRNAEALAAEVIDLFDHEVERHAMRKRAYNFCREMIWKEVARQYLEVFAQVKHERERAPRRVFHIKTLKHTTPELPKPNFNHLALLTDDTGILHHAVFTVPDRSHGYNTDDNARALLAASMAQKIVNDDKRLSGLAHRYLGFLQYAFDETTRRFHSRLSYDRRWLDEVDSEICQGRAIWGLGVTVGFSTSTSLTGAALRLFERALPTMVDLQSPQTLAFALVGIHAYLRRFSGDSEARRIREILASRLFERYQANAVEEWPWIEPVVAEAAAKIPQALLMSGQWLQKQEMIEAGTRSLDWLLRLQTNTEGYFAPIGNHGWFAQDGQPARFDQQPIETMNTIEACIEAYHVTGEQQWVTQARRCFNWFLGQNDLKTPLYDYTTGGCCDSLTADGPNQNQGAEAAIAWLLSLLHIYALGSTSE